MLWCWLSADSDLDSDSDSEEQEEQEHEHEHEHEFEFEYDGEYEELWSSIIMRRNDCVHEIEFLVLFLRILTVADWGSGGGGRATEKFNDEYDDLAMVIQMMSLVILWCWMLRMEDEHLRPDWNNQAEKLMSRMRCRYWGRGARRGKTRSCEHHIHTEDDDDQGILMILGAGGAARQCWGVCWVCRVTPLMVVILPCCWACWRL